jgi:hypothetical protein
LLAPEGSGDLLSLSRDFLRLHLLLPREGMPLQDQMEERAAAIRANPNEFKAAIDSLNRLLTALADGDVFKWPFVKGSRVVMDGAAIKADDLLGGVSFESPNSLAQALTLSALIAVSQGEGRLVRRCARDICRRIFLATRPKQIFCGRQCASAAGFERYKQGLGEEEYRKQHRKVAKRWKQNQKERQNRRRSQRREEK